MESNCEFEYTKGCVVPKDVTIVRFHPSVVEIGTYVFNNCKQLNEVILNEGLLKIGHSAFWRCTSLSSIKLPSTITEIGECAFSGCSILREVELNDGLKKIGEQAFCCTSLSGITFPSTVTEIWGRAFDNCSNLNEVVFNEGLQKIGGHAFACCISLSSIKLPSTITEIFNGAFGGCSNLREVVFRGVPREIGKNAFQDCTSAERFTFPTISMRLDALVRTGHWEEIENEVNEVRGVVGRSGGELFVSSEAMVGGRNYLGGGNWRFYGRNWNQVRDDLDKIIRLITYYELKEGTSIFELALWKFKLDQVDKANPIPRKKCHMDAPGPVKDIILQYLR